MGEQKIRILEDSLIDKIAAGEVVENPSSVVKELIENSIDANSDSIEIEIREGGKSLIKIKDNGDGMNKIDAELCIKRHATSKIKNENDLFAIKTLGFRGEALASISAVSKFKIITRGKKEISGTEVKIERDKIISNDIGTELGTTIVIEDLFYNVPARKKFLRNIEAELSSISDIIIRYALAYPNISFKLINNDKIILNSVKTNDSINTIQSIYGTEIAKNMIFLDYSDDIIKIKGFIGKPSIARKDKQRQTIFLNGRYIKSKEISNAIKEGYYSMLFLDREPISILDIKINEKKVDVNVHPRKEIVKIDNIKELEFKITEIIRDKLKQTNLILESDLNTSNSKPQNKYTFEKDKQTNLSFENDTLTKINENQENYTQKNSSYDNIKIETRNIGEFKIFGQVNKTYILAENAEGLLIIDQHAAQERINYEKLIKQLKENAISKQSLVKPIILEMSLSEFNIIKQYLEQLKKTGYDIEEYGQNSVIVRSIPFIFERVSKAHIEELVEQLKEVNRNKIEQEIEDRIIRFSCRMSIKGGEEITSKEIEQLIKDLDKCEMPWTCPHGRPTVIKLSISDIEKKFKRK
jgi:DNA mismatch repair protein MutL